jgi:hypothetical protein
MSKAKKWRCFFCDEVFTDRRSAWAHFGEPYCESDPPACVDPLRTDEKARMTELREAREHAIKMQAESERNDDAEGLLEQFRADLQRYFGKDCTSVWLAGDRYQSALNRLHDLKSGAAFSPQAVDTSVRGSDQEREERQLKTLEDWRR